MVDQIMHRLAEHLPDLPPDHGRRRRIHERHVPGDVEAEDAFTSGLEDEFVLAAGAFQGLLRPLHFRDMLLNRRRPLVTGAGQSPQPPRRRAGSPPPPRPICAPGTAAPGRARPAARSGSGYRATIVPRASAIVTCAPGGSSTFAASSVSHSGSIAAKTTPFARPRPSSTGYAGGRGGRPGAGR